MQRNISRTAVFTGLTIFMIAVLALTISSSFAARARPKKPPVTIEVFAPDNGDHAGVGGKGWFIDLAIHFDTGSLKKTGFNGFQLTGPLSHDDTAPMPGTFSTGKDDRLPGLVVLLSTTTSTLGGPGTNLANLFNLTGVTNVSKKEIELWDTWIISAPNFGVNKKSTMLVAEVADLNHDGIFNDAPNMVPDSNKDGKINERDLKALGLASAIQKKVFFINK